MKFTVPGRPVSKNGTYERRQGAGPGLRLSDKAEDFVARVKAAAISTCGHHRPVFLHGGIVIITEAHFTKDADAGAVSALVQDALQGIAYDNDSQVLFAGGWKGDPDPENPRVEVSVSQLVIGTASVNLDVPPYVWRTEADRRASDMRAILPSGTREKINQKRLVPSAKRYGI